MKQEHAESAKREVHMGVAGMIQGAGDDDDMA